MKKFFALQRYNTNHHFWRLLLFIGSFALTGCGPGYIQNTKIPATARNKAVYAVLQAYHDAITKGQWSRLLKLVSPRFHETRGTSDPSDDYGYEELRKKLLSPDFQKVKVLRYTFKVEKIDYPKKDEAHVYLRIWHSFRYPRGSYRPGFDAGSLRHILILERTNGQWLIRRGI